MKKEELEENLPDFTGLEARNFLFYQDKTKKEEPQIKEKTSGGRAGARQKGHKVG